MLLLCTQGGHKKLQTFYIFQSFSVKNSYILQINYLKMCLNKKSMLKEAIFLKKKNAKKTIVHRS